MNGGFPSNVSQEVAETLTAVHERIQELGGLGEFGNGRATSNQLVDDVSNLVPMPTSVNQINRLRDEGLEWPDGQIHNGPHSAEYHERLAEILEDSLGFEDSPGTVIAGFCNSEVCLSGISGGWTLDG